MVNLILECPHCGYSKNILITQEELDNFHIGNLPIQKCFPNLTVIEQKLLSNIIFDETLYGPQAMSGPNDIECQCNLKGIQSEWVWDNTQLLFKCTGCGDTTRSLLDLSINQSPLN